MRPVGCYAHYERMRTDLCPSIMILHVKRVAKSITATEPPSYRGTYPRPVFCRLLANMDLAFTSTFISENDRSWYK